MTVVVMRHRFPSVQVRRRTDMARIEWINTGIISPSPFALLLSFRDSTAGHDREIGSEREPCIDAHHDRNAGFPNDIQRADLNAGHGTRIIQRTDLHAGHAIAEIQRAQL